MEHKQNYGNRWRLAAGAFSLTLSITTLTYVLNHAPWNTVADRVLPQNRKTAMETIESALEGKTEAENQGLIFQSSYSTIDSVAEDTSRAMPTSEKIYAQIDSLPGGRAERMFNLWNKRYILEVYENGDSTHVELYRLEEKGTERVLLKNEFTGKEEEKISYETQPEFGGVMVKKTWDGTYLIISPYKDTDFAAIAIPLDKKIKE